MAILKDVPFEEYVVMKGMNHSTLQYGFKSMRALKYHLDNGREKESSGFSIGTASHTLLLEPEEFENTYIVMPDYASMPENRTKDGKRSYNWTTVFAKQMKANFLMDAEEDGKTVVTAKDYRAGLRISESVYSNPRARDLIETCDTELTLTGEIDGVECKGRLDLAGEGLFADLKTTASVLPSAFGRSFANFNYSSQMAFYRELYIQNYGGVIPLCEVIAVENGGDYDCVVYDIPEQVIDLGWGRVCRVIAEYKTALETDHWPRIGEGETTLPLVFPNWAMPEDGSEEEYDLSGMQNFEGDY